MSKPLVAILMGSDSDLPVMNEAADILKEFGVSCKVQVMSAHRCPEVVSEFASHAAERGYRVLIAGAGSAAHLAGVVAAHTILPVIGVPIDSSPLKGFDSLLSTAQMPAGIPVATVAVGKAGARNAGLLAVQMLALSDTKLAQALEIYKKKLIAGVIEKNKKLNKEA